MNERLAAIGNPDAERPTLMFGIGNSSRSDDALGWAFLDRIDAAACFDGRLEYRFQLQVEDAALIRDAQRVVFVDSWSGTLPGGYRLAACEPTNDVEYTSHILAPQAVMSLCQELYGACPRAETLLIEGADWALKTGLSAGAARNLEAALQYFCDYWQRDVAGSVATG